MIQVAGSIPGGLPCDLAARLFRALYPGFELKAVGAIYVATPKGTPCYAGPTLTEIARQISAAAPPAPGPDLRYQPRHQRAGACA